MAWSTRLRNIAACDIHACFDSEMGNARENENGQRYRMYITARYILLALLLRYGRQLIEISVTGVVGGNGGNLPRERFESLRGRNRSSLPCIFLAGCDAPWSRSMDALTPNSSVSSSWSADLKTYHVSSWLSAVKRCYFNN